MTAEDEGRIDTHPLAGRLSDAQAAEVQNLISTVGSDAAIWKWVRNPENESAVRELAAMLLVERFRTRKRAEARKVEQANIQRWAEERVAARDAMTELEKQEESSRWAEKRARDAETWERYAREEAEAKRARREAAARDVLDSILAVHAVPESEITIEQIDLVSAGLLPSDLLFGAEAEATMRSFNKQYSDWVEAPGHKIKRRELVRQAERADDDRWGFFRSVHVAQRRYEQNLKAEWSLELLASTFRVDGVTVTWGAATIEQHERRSESLRSHAEGTLQTAALHQQAVRHLRSIHADSLADAIQGVPS